MMFIQRRLNVDASCTNVMYPLGFKTPKHTVLWLSIGTKDSPQQTVQEVS